MFQHKKYCLDTNVLINAWNGYYSMQLCPDYWEALSDLADKGIIFCTMEVKREIETIDDALLAWVNTKPNLFKEVCNETQIQLAKILAVKKYQRLVDSSRGRSIADPWVIAHAIAEKAIVVTKEASTPMDAVRIKIPDVCKELKVPYMNDFQFLEAIGLKFSIAR